MNPPTHPPACFNPLKRPPFSVFHPTLLDGHSYRCSLVCVLCVCCCCCRSGLEEKHAAELAAKDEEVRSLVGKMGEFEEAMRHLEQIHAEDRMSWQREEEAAKEDLERVVVEERRKLAEGRDQWKGRAEAAERMLTGAAEKLKQLAREAEQKDKVVADLRQTVAFMEAERAQENAAFDEKGQAFEARLSQVREECEAELAAAEQRFMQKLVQYVHSHPLTRSQERTLSLSHFR